MFTKSHKFAAVLGLLLSVTACQTTDRGVSALSSESSVETIAEYPHGAFLENLDVGPNGDLLFTSYMDRSLYRWNGEGTPTRLTQLDVHPVGILSRANDIILSAHGTSFAKGAAFTKTNQLLVLDASGKLLRRTPAPEALFLNGMVELAPSIVLAADSLAARIWSFDPATGDLATWLADPLLATDPSQTAQRPGANGLKIRNGWLYISNSSRGALYRVRLKDGRPHGGIETVATPGPVDDFAFLPDGSIAAATHGAKLIRIAADGAVTEIMSDGCDACTSVAPFGSNGSLIVLTTGDLLEGGDKPARVLRIAAPTKAIR